MKTKALLMIAVGTLLGLSSCNQQKWVEESKGSYNLVTQQGGQTLGYSHESGVEIITNHGFAFKDLNRNGI